MRTAGILLKEGVTNATVPCLTVLEIGTLGNKRHPSDILPFIPVFRPHFRALPPNASAMHIKTVKVPLTDLECVTNTVVKSTGPIWYLNIKKGTSPCEFSPQLELQCLLDLPTEAAKFADKELTKYTKSWNDSAWDELDWSRVKELQVRDIINKRNEQVQIMQSCRCLSCPDFLKHVCVFVTSPFPFPFSLFPCEVCRSPFLTLFFSQFEMQNDMWQVKEHITQVKQLMSDQNLQLLPDYEQRIEVLKELGFVDEQSRVQLKGKVACEIHSADELVLTELILDNVLAEFEPEEIVALLSAFVFQEKTESVPHLTPRLEKGQKAIIAISEKVNNLQVQYQVIQSSEDSNDFASQPRFGLAEVVYEWARGMSFNRITDLTDVMEGTVVRCITRLDETCREVKGAAKLVGDPNLYAKMEKAQELIKRDVIFAASLYM